MHTLKQPPKKGVQSPSPSPSILVAEDNLLNQKLMSILFSKLNVQIDLVSNGQEAVEAASLKSYDLILMDIQMPVMDGIEACCQIKDNLKEAAPVIIALTANAMNGDRERYIQCGLDHYLSKPVSFEDIKMAVAQYTTI